ncbi:hypothetical protein [Subtercola lobariae]|uniref:hypothetical protein n=1 Tax=Subtercola lobariae TaxID=1588641 RepID=UPI00166CDA2F|nr:hypothetical protein [Subtercola lobariae]
MSSTSRELHIKKAIDELRQRPDIPETERLQFRGHFQTFEVIELPLDVPILNARSFRIAPLLADHPDRGVVETDPESPKAQAIVTDLVRKSHRHIDGLRGSLESQGQAQPGVITRSGKLINGNSRCVLLRGLVAEGKIPASTTIRVAVLPGDTDNKEELDLESVLQQQKEFKDEYNLVARLMMIQSLYDNGMTDESIAASLRVDKAADIKRLREVLVLMNRSRSLTADPLPLSIFVTVEDQQQNWIDLLKEVRDIENLYGREPADEHIRGWLIAYFSGHSAVHQLRKAKGDWITRDLVPHLAEAGRDGDSITQTLSAEETSTETAAPAAAPAGLDLLDVDSSESTPASSSVTQRVLDLVVKASQDPEREFAMADGTSLTGQEIKRVMHGSVAEGLNNAAQRKKDANRLVRPQSSADSAASSLKSLVEALEDVADDPEFSPRIDDLKTTLDLVQSRLEEVLSIVADIKVPITNDEENGE